MTSEVNLVSFHDEEFQILYSSELVPHLKNCSTWVVTKIKIYFKLI